MCTRLFWRAFCSRCCKVVIESPRHNKPTATASVDELLLVLKAWRERGQQLAENEHLQHIVYFKNQGGGAGASLVHPHAQIVALPFVPRNVQAGQSLALRHFERFSTSMYDGITEQMRAEGDLLLDEQGGFVSFVPFAAPSPFTMFVFE